MHFSCTYTGLFCIHFWHCLVISLLRVLRISIPWNIICLLHCKISSSIIIHAEQSKQKRAFSLFQSQMKCHSPEFQMLEISSFVFTSYLYKSQNRISLRGICHTACFKCKTNKFLIQVLKFRFHRKCRVNQMWKYHRVMNISL